MLKQHHFTSESVSEGHPDKLCDIISDSIVDFYLTQEDRARTAVEVMVTTNFIAIAGEVRCAQGIQENKIEDIARRVVQRVGYEQQGFHWKNNQVMVRLHGQSEDIARGVDGHHEKKEGAGDQGIMFGYACDETDTYMPAPIYYAHTIIKNLTHARHQGKLQGLQPDAKSQVTLLYENGVPVRATSVVVSTQHDAHLSQSAVRAMVYPYVKDALPKGWMCPDEDFHVNPTGVFVIGGPDGDVGLTGRKIIVDTYGGAAPHGGGAFSGKDPSKVDRSAAYAARYLAKNVLQAKLARRCTIQLSYGIGLSRPLSLYVDTHGTGKVEEKELARAFHKVMDLSPRGICDHLCLNRPIYARTASCGHFGRDHEADGGFSWEKTDISGKLLQAL